MMVTKPTEQFKRRVLARIDQESSGAYHDIKISDTVDAIARVRGGRCAAVKARIIHIIERDIEYDEDVMDAKGSASREWSRRSNHKDLMEIILQAVRQFRC